MQYLIFVVDVSESAKHSKFVRGMTAMIIGLAAVYGCNKKLDNPSDYIEAIKVGYTKEQVKEIAGEPYVVTIGLFERFLLLTSDSNSDRIYDHWNSNLPVPPDYPQKVELGSPGPWKAYYYLVGHDYAIRVRLNESGFVTQVEGTNSMKIESQVVHCQMHGSTQKTVNPSDDPEYEFKAELRGAALSKLEN